VSPAGKASAEDRIKIAAGAFEPKSLAIDVVALIDNQPLSPFQVRTFLLIGTLVLMDGFDVQAIGFVAPALQRDWQLPMAALGPIFASGLVGMLLGSTSLGLLADRIGRRPVLIGSTLLFALATLGTAAARGPTVMMIFRFLTGYGIGSVMGSAVTLASEYCPSARRASLLLAISCGFTGGAILGGVASGMLIPRFGWPSVFIVGGILPLLIALALIRDLPESLQLLLVKDSHRHMAVQWLRRLRPNVPLTGESSFRTLVMAQNQGSVGALFQGGRAFVTPLLWVASFANLLNLYFLANWLPLLASRMRLSDASGVAVGVSLQFGGILGALLLGPLIDRRGFYRVLAPIFALGAIVIALVGRPELPTGALFLCVTIAGICIVGGQPAINALAASLYPTALRATGVGWCLGIGRAGSILGPLVAAQFIARHASNEQLFLLASAPSALAAIVILAMRVIVGRNQPGLDAA
jgi:AAHS family 4-hydroxybenzoate transporter-like MFS transporter